MEELNICALFILSNQPTTQPAYQPKSDKCAYLWRFSTNLVEIWCGVSKWKDSTHVCDLLMFEHANWPNQPTTQPAHQPKSSIGTSKSKNERTVNFLVDAHSHTLSEMI